MILAVDKIILLATLNSTLMLLSVKPSPSMFLLTPSNLRRPPLLICPLSVKLPLTIRFDPSISSVPLVLIVMLLMVPLPLLSTVWAAQMIALSAALGTVAAAAPLHETVDQVDATFQSPVARE